MKSKHIIGLVIFGIALVVAALAILLHGDTFAVLEPAGLVATQERSLLYTTTLLTLIVIVPILALTFFFRVVVSSRQQEGAVYAK